MLTHFFRPIRPFRLVCPLIPAILSFLFMVQAIEVQPCWAGDQMNIDFLTRQAVNKSARLKKWDNNIKDELYGTSLANHIPGALDIVSEGIFGASFGIQSFKPDLAMGLTAMSVGIVSTLVSEVQEARSNKRVRQLFSQIEQYNLRVAQEVQSLYPAFKDGATEARAKLVEMTSEETVAEVQNNLDMEAFLRNNIKHTVHGEQPSEKLVQTKETLPVPVSALLQQTTVTTKQ